MILSIFRIEYLMVGTTVLGTATLVTYKTTQLFPKQEILDAKFFQVDKNTKLEGEEKVEEVRTDFVKSLKDYMKFFPDATVIKYKNQKKQSKKIKMEWLSGISDGKWKDKGKRNFIRGKKYYEVRIWANKNKRKKTKCRYTWREAINPTWANKRTNRQELYTIFKKYKKMCKKEETKSSNRNQQA